MKAKLGKFFRRGDRRIDIKIENHDTWNLDHTLALIIYPALLQLKATKHGLPSNFIDDKDENHGNGQQCFDFIKEDSDFVFEESIKRWDETLDKMIWSFQQIAIDDYDDQYHHGEAKYDFVKSLKKFPNPISGKIEDTFQMVDTNPDEHWYDYVGHQMHEDRIQEGLDLFAKYYRNLWD